MDENSIGFCIYGWSYGWLDGPRRFIRQVWTKNNNILVCDCSIYCWHACCCFSQLSVLYPPRIHCWNNFRRCICCYLCHGFVYIYTYIIIITTTAVKLYLHNMLVLEMVRPSKRRMMGIGMQFLFTIGYVSFGGLAYFIRN